MVLIKIRLDGIYVKRKFHINAICRRTILQWLTKLCKVSIFSNRISSLTLPTRGWRFRHTSNTPPGNHGSSCFRPHVALNKLDLFRNWAHMQKKLMLCSKTIFSICSYVQTGKTVHFYVNFYWVKYCFRLMYLFRFGPS